MSLLVISSYVMSGFQVAGSEILPAVAWLATLPEQAEEVVVAPSLDAAESPEETLAWTILPALCLRGGRVFGTS